MGPNDLIEHSQSENQSAKLREPTHHSVNHRAINSLHHAIFLPSDDFLATFSP
jgi:hypothetical protein